MRPERAAYHSPPSSAAVMEEYSYTSTDPLGHTGRVTRSLYLYNNKRKHSVVKCKTCQILRFPAWWDVTVCRGLTNLLALLE